MTTYNTKIKNYKNNCSQYVSRIGRNTLPQQMNKCKPTEWRKSGEPMRRLLLDEAGLYTPNS